MTTDSWHDSKYDSEYDSKTEEELDALAAEADKAMTKGWEEYLAANPLNPEIAELVDFVFGSIGASLPPYGSPERAGPGS